MNHCNQSWRYEVDIIAENKSNALYNCTSGVSKAKESIITMWAVISDIMNVY